MQWLREHVITGGVFGRPQTPTGAGRGRFTRNDSSNSNMSSNANNSFAESLVSASPVGGGSCHNIRYGRSDSANSTPVPSHRPLHAKLSGKQSTQSATVGLSNLNISSSLRRQRFKQQHQAKLRERRLSRQASSGTSVSTSQELSIGGSGSCITANPIVDRLLDYIREHCARTMDPFCWDINKKVKLTSFASFRFETGQISGTSNFERVGDSKLIKSLGELTSIILACHIVFSDLYACMHFSTKVAKIIMRNKELNIFLEKAIVYVEISVDHTMSAKLKTLRLISIDGLECRSRGIAFPVNKSFDSFANKTIYNIAKDCDRSLSQLVPVINQFCDQYFESALKSLSITDLFW